MGLLSEEQRTFQRREWVVQRVGTVLLVAFVLAGLAGLLGTGPFSSTTRSSTGGIVSVDVDRTARFKADDTITFTFAPEAVQDGTVTLQLTGQWISGVNMQDISPEPLEQRSLPDGIEMTFSAEPSGATQASLSFRAEQLLALPGQATVEDETVAFTQFVLP